MADNIQRLTLDTPTIRSLLKKIRKMCRADGDYIDIATSTSETRATQTLNNTTFKVVPLADADMTGLVGRRNVTLEDFDGVVNAEAQMDNHKRFFCTAQVRIKVTSAVNNVVNVNFKCGVDRTHVVSTTAVLDCTYAHEFDKTLTWMADHTLSTKIWAALGENGSGASVTVEVVQLSITQVPAISNGGGQGGGGEYYSGLGIYVDPNDEINVMTGTGLTVNPLTNELEVSSELIESKENVSNKKQSIDPTSTTEYGSSKAVADFVNSSVATNTATFLGNFKLQDLGLTYPATEVQIAAALNSHTWPTDFPTNNDYVYVEIKNPQSTIDDKVQRYKYRDVLASWGYEYTLNNSSFTAEEKAAIDSGITSQDVVNLRNDHTTLGAHVGNSGIHVTSSDKTAWDAKQNAVNTDTDENAFGDDTTIATGFGSGKVHLNIASRLWTYISGKVFSDNGKVPASNIPDSIKDKIVFIEASFNIATQVFTCNDASYNDITGYLQSGKVPVVRVSVYANASATTPVRIHDLYYHGYDSQVESPNTGKYKFGSTDGCEDGSRAYVTSVKCNDSTGWGDYQDYAVPSLAKMNTDLAGKVDTTGYASNTKSTFTKASGDASSMTSGGKLSAIFTAISSFFASLKAAAFMDVAASGESSSSKVVRSDDSRLSNARAAADSSVSLSGQTLTVKINGVSKSLTNTTYGNATQSAAGLMSASDKTKLDGVATNANNYTHPTTSGNKHIPSGGSSGQILRWSADGTAAWGADYSAGSGLSLSGTTFSLKTGYTTSGKNYKVQLDSNGNPYVNVPWTDTDKSDKTTVVKQISRGADFDPITSGYFAGMTKNSGISGDWWHILSMDWNGNDPNSWISQLALPTEGRNGLYYRTRHNSTTNAWVKCLDTSNYTSYAASSSHTHNYAASSSPGGKATVAVAVEDAGNTSKTVKIDWSSSSMTSTTHLAGFRTVDNQVQIKDIKVENVYPTSVDNWGWGRVKVYRTASAMTIPTSDVIRNGDAVIVCNSSSSTAITITYPNGRSSTATFNLAKGRSAAFIVGDSSNKIMFPEN
ncbi:MAG: hypothetical protein IKB97_09345 [Bacteroidaceae bacterium]|nr:hypothetical protein [Bacteroidaceae bacterium]